MELDIVFLGTSASMPTALRAPPGILVRRGGERLEWKVIIWFPWDEERRLFRGEKVYVSGIEIPER